MNGKLKGKIKEGEKNLGPDLERKAHLVQEVLLSSLISPKI